jgi:hypothetical protein
MTTTTAETHQQLQPANLPNDDDAASRWVRERIMAARPRPEAMAESVYLEHVENFLEQHRDLVHFVAETLSSKRVPAASLRRAFAVGTSWAASFAHPKKDMGKRQVAQVRSSDIVLYTESGTETYLPLAEADVFQIGDAFRVSWKGTLNIVTYTPTDFDSSAAREREAARKQDEAAHRARIKQEQKDAATAADAALWDGFLALPGLRRAQAKTVLDKLIRFGGGTARTGEFIRHLVGLGYRVEGERLINAERNSFYEKKVLGSIAFQYAVFLADKLHRPLFSDPVGPPAPGTCPCVVCVRMRTPTTSPATISD